MPSDPMYQRPSRSHPDPNSSAILVLDRKTLWRWAERAALAVASLVFALSARYVSSLLDRLTQQQAALDAIAGRVHDLEHVRAEQTAPALADHEQRLRRVEEHVRSCDARK